MKKFVPIIFLIFTTNHGISQCLTPISRDSLKKHLEVQSWGPRDFHIFPSRYDAHCRIKGKEEIFTPKTIFIDSAGTFVQYTFNVSRKKVTGTCGRDWSPPASEDFDGNVSATLEYTNGRLFLKNIQIFLPDRKDTNAGETIISRWSALSGSPISLDFTP